jgi:hypothetical protein
VTSGELAGSEKRTMGRTPAGDRRQSQKRKSEGVGTTTTIQSLDQDILCMIFALLDFFDLVRCSAVCKFWYFSSFVSFEHY